MNKCVSQKYLTLNRKIDLNFTLEQCAVQTVQSIPTIHNEESFEFGYLQLSIEFELKDYESLSKTNIANLTISSAIADLVSWVEVRNPIPTAFSQH
jgi:hypothetical protein